MKTNDERPRGDWSSMPEWITVDEAAEASGYHPEYVRYLARKGKIGAEKKGRDWWINPAKFQAYLAVVKELGTKKHAGIHPEIEPN